MYCPSLGIVLSNLIHAPNKNNCILVKNGRVGYKTWCPNNKENIITYNPNIKKYIPPNKYKKMLINFNTMIYLYLKC